MFTTIGVTTKRKVDNNENFTSLINFLVKSKKQVFLSSHARENLNDEFSDLETINYNKKIDLLIAYGGDGTILRAARNIKNFNTYILGINGGHLGFLSTMPAKNFANNLDRIFAGKFIVAKKSLCRVQHIRNKQVLLDTKILNDAVISYRNVARLINIDTKIDRTSLCKYFADGLIISTPTGSTAYNLAAGGPILYPSLKALIITPICSHSFTQKPIVLPEYKKITLSFKDNDELLNLTLDGQRSFEVYREDIIKIELMKEQLGFIRLPEQNFYKNLRNKLNWGKTLR